jgi:hypothetical protein
MKMEIEVSKRVLLACVAALAFSSNAIAITFSNVQLDVTAIATTDGPAGFDSSSSPPSVAPVSASAASLGITTDVATAGAIAGLGLLNASADATGISGIANSVGTAHFAASFLLTAADPYLIVDFTPQSFASGTGLAASSLFLTLTSGATTVFSDFITGTFSRFLGPVSGTLDLTLTSEASAGFPQPGVGNSSSFGLATVTSAVPLPAPWLLLLVGAGPLAAVKRRVGRALSKAA